MANLVLGASTIQNVSRTVKHVVAVAGTDVGRDGGCIATEKFSVEEEEQLVVLDRPTDAQASLVTPFRRVDAAWEDLVHRRAIDRVQRAIAEELVGAAVICVAARAGNGVHHPAGGMSEFRGIVGADDLEFLNCVLRDVIGTSTTGVLSVVAVGGIDTIREEVVSARCAAEREKSEGAVIRN